MALFTVGIRVEYDAQQCLFTIFLLTALWELKVTSLLAFFESFLKEFKSTTVEDAEMDIAAADAIGRLQMNDDANSTPRSRARRGARGRSGRAAQAGRAQQQEPPKLKYMTQLQEIANRARDSITIELDDLDAVGLVSSVQ